ncbi:MAG: MotA/TolQ/ExbB proton channel family protein [Bacteroidaceae bacterium]|nr:MotA/TolQ/ExbB proton channel family protein [Bacteroidaceae bacterium]
MFRENTTTLSLAFISLVFIYFLWEVLKLPRITKQIRLVADADDILTAIGKTRLSNIKDSYVSSFIVQSEDGDKTNIPSSEYFSSENVCATANLNIRMIDTASGTLVGLGLLGTFLGLTLGIQGFDSSDTTKIQESIEMLLGGMATAFATSLLGMSLSIIFIFIDKSSRNKLSKQLSRLTEKLDRQYYIDDVALASKNQEQLLVTLYDKIQTLIINQSSAIISSSAENAKSINDKLVYSNSDSQVVSIGNAIREILAESTEQTKALKSFSTDLAIELNNGFDESLSRQMQQKILPLMENVDATTKAIIQHIDMVSEKVTAPANEMIQGVVSELKDSMATVVDEFKSSISKPAVNELEGLAMQLGTATQAMAEFPQNMDRISIQLQTTINEVKSAVADISTTSANANSTAMQQMQEQISFATGAISEAINEVHNVIDGISTTSQEQSNQMISKLADASEKMGAFLNSTISSLSSSVQESVASITTDISNKQADLIALQEDTTTETRKLLETFNEGIIRLGKLNENILGTMSLFQQAQGQIAGSTAHLQTITGDMKFATQLFSKSQNEYSVKMEEIQRNNQRGIDAVKELLESSGEMSSEYAAKFETIKQGLGSIFAQLQEGLTQYSRTVQATTHKYLDQYSSSLTQTTDALSSTIQQQNEIVEMLAESLNSRRH